MKDAISEYRGLFIRINDCWAEYIWSEEEHKWLRSNYSADFLSKFDIPALFDENYRLMLMMKYSQ